VRGYGEVSGEASGGTMVSEGLASFQGRFGRSVPQARSAAGPAVFGPA
jgi:hypothetical protein